MSEVGRLLFSSKQDIMSKLWTQIESEFLEVNLSKFYPGHKNQA